MRQVLCLKQDSVLFSSLLFDNAKHATQGKLFTLTHDTNRSFTVNTASGVKDMDFTVVGTPFNDRLVGRNGMVWGFAGDDILSTPTAAYTNSNYSTVMFGGSGNDKYYVQQGALGLIYDSSGDDLLFINMDYYSSTGVFRIIDNNELIIGDNSTGTAALIYDNTIEGVVFNGVYHTIADVRRKAYHIQTSDFGIDAVDADTIITNLIKTQLPIAENAPYGFNEQYYDDKYADIANAIDYTLSCIAGGYHYATYGIYEGRSPNAAYDQMYYLTNNPDVAAAVNMGIMTGYDHFVQYGQFEGRQGSAAFNADAYLAANPDVAEAVHAGYFATAFQHYAEYGQYEGRPLAVEVSGVEEQAADDAV